MLRKRLILACVGLLPAIGIAQATSDPKQELSDALDKVLRIHSAEEIPATDHVAQPPSAVRFHDKDLPKQEITQTQLKTETQPRAAEPHSKPKQPWTPAAEPVKPTASLPQAEPVNVQSPSAPWRPKTQVPIKADTATAPPTPPPAKATTWKPVASTPIPSSAPPMPPSRQPGQPVWTPRAAQPLPSSKESPKEPVAEPSATPKVWRPGSSK